jgi:hypothetical protein
MKDSSRRSFVKTSAATGLTFTFAGLIRAHGQSGGGNTTWNPEGTFFSTNSGETTTYDPNGTYVTTDPGVTTTWDPDATTTPETTMPEETTNTTNTTQPGYYVKGTPSGPWHNGSGATSNVASMDGWNAQIIVQSDPLSGIGNPVTVSCYVQTWHDSSPVNTITNHMFLALAGAVHSTTGAFASHLAGDEIPDPDKTIVLQTYKDPKTPKIGQSYDVTTYYLIIKVDSINFSALSGSPYHEVIVTATLRKEFLENTHDEYTSGGDLMERVGGTEDTPEELSVVRALKVERMPD